MDVITKICTKCGEEKSLDLFRKRTSTKDGLRTECKSCQDFYNKTRHRKNNPERKINYQNNIDISLGLTNKRVCTKCKDEKLITEFYKNSTKTSGYSSRCKDCSKTIVAQWVEANPERAKQKINEWVKNNSDKIKDNKLKKSFGISLSEYNQLSLIQNHCCAICFTNQSSLKTSLAVDHDHKTGKIRGLLCSNCNTALGLLKDSVENFNNAVVYLQKQQELKWQI